jgi:nitrogen regulatory protein P-II 1
MKRIDCYIQPYDLHKVAEALAVEGVRGLTAIECKGFGVQRGFVRGEEVKPGQFVFHPKVTVEMVVCDEDAEAVIEKVKTAIKASLAGEGKIFIMDVEDAVRIRTGERGDAAIK